ncbi:geranylgeranyl reductase family protein [Georgenia yuyongxinii]
MAQLLEGDAEADVVVVGAGPAGSSAAFFLAQAGLEVLLLEKGAFPREKVCGDGLTPRAVRMLLGMGVDVSAGGWSRTRGLRMVAGRAQLELDWPELEAFPSYGLVRSRWDLDTLLARRAVAAGARLYERTTAVAPVVDDRSGRVTGVRAHFAPADGDRGPDVVIRAPVVVAADGVSSRLALAMGLQRRADRPLGVAVRAYYASPRHTDDYLEAWVQVPDGGPGGRLLPGYGWVFGMGDGTCNVGVVSLNAPRSARHVDYRSVLSSWLAPMPREWGFREEERTSAIAGAALPMGFNRTPHYVPGLVLVGDAGGMVNPFTGEGISYALESGQMAADVVLDALRRPSDRARDDVLAAYPTVTADAYGRYFAWGRGFVKVINHPAVLAAATQHGLSHPALMRLVFRLLSHLGPGGGAADRTIGALRRLVPR